ncbi:MAG: YkgJ family cysteine cluster protein [Deltaproteobacteria bacterium]|nr:YkgJ family cysteine cluster protein [Deltaproteobacteria bacterium]
MKRNRSRRIRIGKLWRQLWARKAPRSRRGCRACGVCCEVFAEALSACPEDLERWRAQGRRDLLARVGSGGELWTDPETGLREPACPFLSRSGPDRALCGIHDTKPELCRRYPSPVHGSRCLLGTRFDPDGR